MTSAEILTTIANLRGSTEYRVAQDYTYPQALHIAETYMKDRMMVVRQVSKTFGGGKDKKVIDTSGQQEKAERSEGPVRATGTDSRGLYPWYDPPYRSGRGGRKRRTVHKVVPLDGPMETLEPYMGKGRIRQGGTKVSRVHRTKKTDMKVREQKRGS